MNNLTHAENERIAKFTEEIGEVNQVVGKILLYGWSSFFENIHYNNKEDLEREVGDLLSAIDLLVAGGDIDIEKVMKFKNKKKKSIVKYLHHQDYIFSDPSNGFG